MEGDNKKRADGRKRLWKISPSVIRGCIQKFPDRQPGARTASGIALYQ